MPKWKEIYEHIAKLPIELKHRIESVYRPESNIPTKLANHLLDFDEFNDKSNKDIAKHNIITFLYYKTTQTCI